MGFEAVIFAAAVVLLAALIYTILSNRYRSRQAHALAEEVTRRRHQEVEDAGVSRPPPTPRVSEPNGVEPAFSEDDIQRDLFGPRGVKGAPDRAVMTPQRAKKTPSTIDQGHVS
jgi:hypothetical protein